MTAKIATTLPFFSLPSRESPNGSIQPVRRAEPSQWALVREPVRMIVVGVEQGETMWRAFFLAIGITVTALGAEFMAVEKAVLKKKQSETGENITRVIQPPEWVPWTLMSAGAVVILYSFTIPRRVHS